MGKVENHSWKSLFSDFSLRNDVENLLAFPMPCGFWTLALQQESGFSTIHSPYGNDF